MIYTVPVVDITVDDKLFQNRVIYECTDRVYIDPVRFYFVYLEEGVTYHLNGEDFVEVPPETKLDSRKLKDIIYDDRKQRDSDYHKVYKERMGIIVMTWEEEQYLRYKNEHESNKNPGQPEDDNLHDGFRSEGSS